MDVLGSLSTTTVIGPVGFSSVKNSDYRRFHFLWKSFWRKL